MSAGAGAFVRAARTVWSAAEIVAIEPSDRVTPAPQADAWAAGTWEDFKHDLSDAGRVLVIGNPPYNLPGDGRGENPTTAERHVLLALDRMRDGGVLVFLLRLSFLSGGSRIRRLHAKYPLAALWPVTPRPTFTLDGKTDGSEYGVFIWRKSYSGQCDLRPLVWREEK